MIMPMRVRNISKKVEGYMKINRKHIGKTVVVHNINESALSIIRILLPDTRKTIADWFSPGCQFRPPIALRTDLSHITTELWEIPVLQMAH